MHGESGAARARQCQVVALVIHAAQCEGSQALSLSGASECRCMWAWQHACLHTPPRPPCLKQTCQRPLL